MAKALKMTPAKFRSIPFKTILARAEKRKGGPKALERLLPKKPSARALEKMSDDRFLSEMTQRVFSAGFAWSVIEAKWQGFETAFLDFNPAKLTFQPDDYWDGLLKDTRIVRNGAKISSVRQNAAFVQAIAKEHGSFGKFLSGWPSSDEIGLLDLLTKRGSRLGGNTGQMFLRFVGWDGFVTSRDVVACQGTSTVQCLGRGDGAAVRASVAHLRHVGRRELSAEVMARCLQRTRSGFQRVSVRWWIAKDMQKHSKLRVDGRC
jgi:3-methyladenine DNA glycosylase Tag